jgi:hypothetical protein
MAMSKRIQIPVEEPELALVKAAASRAGRPLAEWARAVLRDEARHQLGEARLDPKSALKSLFTAEAPVDDVAAMIEESLAGRLR